MRRFTNAQPMGGASLCSFISSAAYSGGKASGMVEKEPAAFRRWHDLGMRFLVCDSDSNMLYAAAVNDVKALNEFAER